MVSIVAFFTKDLCVPLQINRKNHRKCKENSNEGENPLSDVSRRKDTFFTLHSIVFISNVMNTAILQRP